MKELRFGWRMALRELRRGRRKFVFFLLCIAIGVAGLVGIRGFNASLQGALLREARTLMAADMQLTLNQPAKPAQAQVLEGLSSRGIAVAHNIETISMAVNPAAGSTTLVQLKAVGKGYPFWGALELAGVGGVIGEALPRYLSDDNVLVGSELLDRLGLKSGDKVKLGEGIFTVGGVITKEPDRVMAGLGVGPRVMLTHGGLARTKLIQVGSRASYIYLFKLASDEQVEPVRAELREAFKGDRPRIADFREAQPQVRRFLDRLTAFLSLVSMVAMLVGGLGVANATRVFIQQKLDAIAIMKVVGATTRRILVAYLTQMLMLSLAGSLLGVALGYAIQLVMPQVVGNFLDIRLDLTLHPVVALQGIMVGLFTAVLFTLIPLTAIADVKPALVFRREMAESRPRPSGRTLVREALLYATVGVGLALISSWVAGSLLWGFAFMGGLAGAVLLLGGASYLAVRLVKRIRVPRSYVAARQGLANLYRPGSQAGAVVLALGVGVTLVLGVFLMQRNLMAEVQRTTPAGAPNMFFIGLTGKDAPEFAAFLKAQPGVEKAPELTPLSRARLVKIDGKTKQELQLAPDEERWFDFQFQVTHSEKVPEGNQIIAGQWWTAAATSRKLVSVETEAATRLKIGVGSIIDMELEGGIPIRAEVANIRKTVDFRAGNGFNFVFSPGALEGAPISYLAQAKVAPNATGAIQKETVARFPAVTVINLSDVLETVTGVLNQIGLVIRFVAGFSVAAGLIILASSIAATKFRRTRDAVLYKTLGATRGRVWRIFAVEYATLGLVAGVVGALLAAGAAWAVLKWVMEVDYIPEPLPLVLGIGVTTVLTVLVGVLSTLDVLAARPLQVLREE